MAINEYLPPSPPIDAISPVSALSKLDLLFICWIAIKAPESSMPEYVPFVAAPELQKEVPPSILVTYRELEYFKK